MSGRQLRQKTRICYYEPEEPSLDEYLFCEWCSDYVFEYCAIHGPLLVIPDDKIYDRNNKRSHVVDGADAHRSNWMRYVNCSRHWSEQNLVAYQYKGQLYYRTIKIIPRFTELLVFYGSEFANILRVNLGTYNAPKRYANKFGAPVPKKTPLTIQTKPVSKFTKCENLKDKIEEPKTDNTIALENKPLEDIILQAHNESDYDISKSNKSNSTLDHNNVEKEKSQSILGIKIKPYSCDNCRKCFHSKYYLDKHIRTHTGEKPYQCNLCKKCFSEKGNLNKHIRTHTGEKPHQCNICKKCFNQKSNLDTHIRTHTGEKQYQCNVCKKCFNQKGDLVRHIRTHTGEKPYQCNVCKKCFNQKRNLDTHIRTHTGEKPYQCTVCKKCFSQKGYLKYHIRIHIDKKL